MKSPARELKKLMIHTIRLKDSEEPDVGSENKYEAIIIKYLIVNCARERNRNYNMEVKN